MNDLQQGLCELLQNTAERLRESRLPGDMAMQMERLAAQVEQPCEVAIVGRVKAGRARSLTLFLVPRTNLPKSVPPRRLPPSTTFAMGSPIPLNPFAVTGETAHPRT